MQLGQSGSIRLISGLWDAVAKSLAFVGSIMGLDQGSSLREPWRPPVPRRGSPGRRPGLIRLSSRRPWRPPVPRRSSARLTGGEVCGPAEDNELARAARFADAEHLELAWVTTQPCGGAHPGGVVPARGAHATSVREPRRRSGSPYRRRGGAWVADDTGRGRGWVRHTGDAPRSRALLNSSAQLPGSPPPPVTLVALISSSLGRHVQSIP
jgi:hypothetical protein